MCLTSCDAVQFANAASLGWNLVWVLNFVLELYDPLRNTRAYTMYYHGLVWLWAASTSVYIVASGIYGYANLILCTHSCGAAVVLAFL